MSEDELKAEVERLRNEVETYRQRELDELKTQLVAAREAAEHYRNEALQNAENVHKVNALAEETISRLRGQLEAAERTKLQSIRSNHPRAHTRRN